MVSSWIFSLVVLFSLLEMLIRMNNMEEMCVYYIVRNLSSCEISFLWLKIDPKHWRLKFNAQYNSLEDLRLLKLLTYL